jgi:hypothetical protein
MACRTCTRIARATRKVVKLVRPRNFQAVAKNVAVKLVPTLLIEPDVVHTLKDVVECDTLMVALQVGIVVTSMEFKNMSENKSWSLSTESKDG